MNNLDKILNKNYNLRLAEERKAKGFYSSIALPKGQKTLKLLPIQNLFYGNTKCPPRLEMLLDQIKKINDMEDGAFFIGGNLFYYPAGTTEDKTNYAQIYINDLSEILRKADKNKILFMYNGVNEIKFLDDRKLKWPIQTSKILAQNLGIEDRFYDATKVELSFIFNSELTGFENKFMTSLFTSSSPISATTNAIANKLTIISNSNIEKNLIVDTSSSKFYTKKRIINASKTNSVSEYREQTLISTSGYTDMPQIAQSQKNNKYNINQRYIELKIEAKNPALHQDSIRTTNTIKDDPFARTATCLTIGVNYDNYIDFDLYRKLNDELFKTLIAKEEIEKRINYYINKKYKGEEAKLYESCSAKIKQPEEKEKATEYTFE